MGKKHVERCAICGGEMHRVSVKELEKLGADKVIIRCWDGSVCDREWVDSHVPNCDVCSRSPRFVKR